MLLWDAAFRDPFQPRVTPPWKLTAVRCPCRSIPASNVSM